MKISFLMLGLRDHSTGGYVFNSLMADALKDRGHEVDIIHYNTVPDGVKGNRVRGSVHVARRVTAFRPDMAIISKSYSFMFLLRPLLALFRIPVLYLVHHLEWHDRAEGVSSFRKGLVRWFIRSGRNVWVNSRSTADDVEHLGILPERLHIIPPGVTRFPADGEKPDSPVGILSIGTLCPRKDQLTLVRACGELTDLDFHLVIAGDGNSDRPYAAMVKEEALRLGLEGFVRFSGHLAADELYRLYAGSHVLANLSRWEGYGIAVAEALHAGLPVVAADSGAVPELVRHGENGFLVQPGDHMSCACFLRRLIENENLRTIMSAKARESGSRLYSWDETGRDFVRLAEATAAGGQIRRHQPSDT